MNSGLTRVLSRGIADGRQLARGNRWFGALRCDLADEYEPATRDHRQPHMESFFHSMKSDAVHWVSFADDAELVRLLHGYIPYYNGVRLHSGIGYSSPVDYEARTT